MTFKLRSPLRTPLRSLSERKRVGGGPPIPTFSYGLVANRFQVPTTVVSLPVNYTSRRSHYAHPQGDISEIQTIDCNFGIYSTQPQAASARTIKRYIEYPVGVFTQVTWGGLPTVTINADNVVSDKIPLTIPAGELFWERTVNLAANSTFPCQALPASSQAVGSPDGNSASDLGNSGTINPTASLTTFGATAMIGRIENSDPLTFTIVGDSIAYGEGDISSVGVKGGSGWIARWLDALGGFPYLKIAKPGQQAADYVGAMAYPNALLALIPRPSCFNIVEHGINDMRLGRTPAQILADRETITASLIAGGNGDALWTTLLPRSDSSDGYASVAGQTPKTDGTMTQLTALNTSIRARPSNVIEVADAAMSGRNSNVWKAPPVPTTDGTHPNSYMADQLAQAITAAGWT